MQFNEFQRRLRDANLSPQAMFLFTHMFEVQVELSKQLDTAASLITALTETVSGFVALHESTQVKLKKLMEFGRTEGVDVHSVVNDPEKSN